MSDLLSCVEHQLADEATCSIIWLHGLGADGHDFAPVIPELKLPSSLKLRFVFPNAPAKAITINSGHVMPAWFDILEPGKERTINASQLLASAAEVHRLIDRELERGIASERIMLAGFSQGGAVCYHAALTYDKPLAGLVILSSWFPTADVIEVHPANSALPVEVHHGTEDPVLPLWMGEYSIDYLEKLGLRARWFTYPMQHSLCQDEVRQVSGFIQATFELISDTSD